MTYQNDDVAMVVTLNTKGEIIKVVDKSDREILPSKEAEDLLMTGERRMIESFGTFFVRKNPCYVVMCRLWPPGCWLSEVPCP